MKLSTNFHKEEIKWELGEDKEGLSFCNETLVNEFPGMNRDYQPLSGVYLIWSTEPKQLVKIGSAWNIMVELSKIIQQNETTDGHLKFTYALVDKAQRENITLIPQHYYKYNFLST